MVIFAWIEIDSKERSYGWTSGLKGSEPCLLSLPIIRVGLDLNSFLSFCYCSPNPFPPHCALLPVAHLFHSFKLYLPFLFLLHSLLVRHLHYFRFSSPFLYLLYSFVYFFSSSLKLFIVLLFSILHVLRSPKVVDSNNSKRSVETR